MKNWKKHLSPLLSLMMLFSIVSQAVTPIAVYASEVEEPAAEEVEVEETEEIVELDEADEVVEEPEVESEEEPEEEPEVVKAEVEAKAIEATQAAENFELALMHMNDTHARVENYANMLTAIDGFRANNPNSLLFHAGDVFSGTLYFNQFRGEADLAALNLLGIDAMTFGNHEFDLGSPHTALRNFVRDANFPFLGTNIDFSSEPLLADLTEAGSNPSIFDRLVFEVNGERIGVFGLLTEDTANIASPGNVAFTNYIAAAEQSVAAFEADGIDKIIALTHIGYDSAPAYGNDIVLANQVDGIDIIVGGHSHSRLSAPVVVDSGDSPTLIVQAGANADYLGTLQVTFNELGEIVDHNGSLINVTAQENRVDVIPKDQRVLDAIAEYKVTVDEISNEEIGAEALEDLENPRQNDQSDESVRANETSLGNLITDAMLAKTRENYPETVLAFQNGGGIRAPISAGKITLGQVIDVLPFGNNPVVVELTGQELKDLFEIAYGADTRPTGGLSENGGFLHVSGAKIYFDSARPSGDRILAIFIDQDGELIPLDLEDSYMITTNAFTGSGGDSLTPLGEAYAAGRVQDTGLIDWEQLRDYLIEAQYLNGMVNPVLEGRINDLMGEDLPVEAQVILIHQMVDGLEERVNNLTEYNEALRNELAELLIFVEGLGLGNELVAQLEERLLALVAEVDALQVDVPPAGEDEEPTPADPVVVPPVDSNGGGTGTDSTPGTPGAGQSDLPAAGSDMENTLYAGLTVIFAGGVLFVISKRKEEQEA